MRHTRRYYIAIGTIILVALGACTLYWAYAEQLQAQHVKRVDQVLSTLRRRVQTNRDRAIREDSQQIQVALGELWGVVNDQSSPVWHRMVDLAKLYHRGVYPYYKPDIETGNALCRAVILHSSDTCAKADARILLFSLADEASSLDVHPRARSLPIEPAGTLTRLAMSQKATSCHANQTRTRAALNRAALNGHPVPSLADQLVARPPPTIRRDSQNAHDHGVVRHVSKVLTSLPPATNAEAIQREVEEHIATACGDHVSDDDKAAAIQVMESLRDTVDNPALGLSEQEALARVWRRAKHKDLVVQQLASGLEHGHPVCHSGKMARLAAALDDGESESARVLPMWAIKEQLHAVAADVRDQVLAGASSGEVEAYNASDDSRLKQQMETLFKAKCNEFVKDVDLSPIVLRATVDDIVEYGF